jgi:flavin reductase (DIM6/NTAB) family NADH-FMN oxidoreductase RutF
MTETHTPPETELALDSDAFKTALRCWASGVTIVTAKAGDAMHGMTVSAFNSVSDDPPLVLVCANRTSRTHGVIRAAGKFNVNILSRAQEPLSGHFASSKTESSRFEGIQHRIGSHGSPILDGSLVALECEVASAHDEGSHTIYIGRVLACHVCDTEPLVYYQGAYRKIT